MPTTNPTSTTTYARLCYYCHGFLDRYGECDGCYTTREWDHVHATEWDAEGNIVRQYDTSL